MATVLLIPHMDAGDRSRWPGDQDLRSLSELGRRQAEAIARALAGVKLDALYSSPAARCTQTLQPLADRDGLEIEVVTGLREQQREDEDERAFEARCLGAINEIIARAGGGTVAACSHGDVIPAAVKGLAGQHSLPPPEPIRRRGPWCEISVEGGELSVVLRPAATHFPR